MVVGLAHQEALERRAAVVAISQERHAMKRATVGADGGRAETRPAIGVASAIGRNALVADAQRPEPARHALATANVFAWAIGIGPAVRRESTTRPAAGVRFAPAAKRD